MIQQLSYEGNHEMRAAAGARCHVIYNVSPDTSWEAYRVDTDPLEAHDVDSRSGPCAPVRAGLEKWFDGSQVPPGAMEALLPQRPALPKPLGVFLGDEIELLGVELPAQAKGGDAFPVTAYKSARFRLSPQLRQMEIAVSRDRLFLPIAETTGAIWIMDNLRP